MKISTQPKKKFTPLIIIASVVAVLVLGFIAYTLIASRMNENNTNSTDSTDASTVDVNKATDAPSEGLPTDQTQTSDQVPTNDDLTVSIESVSQSDGMVQASAKTSASGTCTFVYKPADGGKPVTRQVGVTGQACAASVSEAEFTYIGQWSLTVTFYNNGEKAEVQKNVSIN